MFLKNNRLIKEVMDPHSCSPFRPRPSLIKRLGWVRATSNVATVPATPAINRECATADTPNTVIDPVLIAKITHHIHAKICNTICRACMSPICLRGLCSCSITTSHILFTIFFIPFSHRSTVVYCCVQRKYISFFRKHFCIFYNNKRTSVRLIQLMPATKI